MENPAAVRTDFEGKFKVPTLRNVAITGPYMHNGAFQELKTAVLFHLRFSDSAIAKANPETRSDWGVPEVTANLAAADLGAQTRTSTDVDALVAFLKTLTDQNYENLVAN
jgi:cytochrome c peroxidase